jgi:hypothetical protein
LRCSFHVHAYVRYLQRRDKDNILASINPALTSLMIEAPLQPFQQPLSNEKYQSK